MFEWLTKNQDIILQSIGLSLVGAVVLGLFCLIVSAFIDHAREVKQIEEDGRSKQAESVQEYPPARTGCTSLDKYFLGMEAASSGLKENKPLARVIRAAFVYDLKQAGVAHEDSWAVATAQMKALFDVEFED
jgi:hypothetical protein